MSIIAGILFFLAISNEFNTAPREGSAAKDVPVIKIQSNFWKKLREKVDKDYDIPMNAVTEKYTQYCKDMTKGYFKNGNILKTRFYLNELEILSGESVEEYGIIFDSNSEGIII